MTRLITRRLICLAIAALTVATPAMAQRAILKSDKTVMVAFRPVVAKPSQSTARVQCDGKDAALGTVVAEDGWIVTKSSELKGKITVTLNGKTYPAVVEGVADKYDLAILKVAATGLKPIEWAASKSALVGDWLAAAGPGDVPVAIGVVSVAARVPDLREMPAPAPPSDSGYMGVQLADEGGATVALVEPKSAADKAGLKVKDVITEVEGVKISSVDQLQRKVQSFKAGDVVSLKIKRDGKPLDIEVTLGKRPTGPRSRGDIQNSMGSTLSERRGGFPAIMQSDLVIKHTDCGGPVVNLDGKAVGVMIARAGRTESYAIPSENVRGLLSDLKSGKLKPNVALVDLKPFEDALNKAKAAVVAKEKALKAEQDEESPDEDKVQSLTADLKALQKKLGDAQKKLDSARKDSTKKD